MSKPLGLATVIACSGLIVLVAIAYALFHGFFDRGDFRMLSVQRSSSGKVAMVAKRSDHEALNGDEIFVLLGSHVLSAWELRYALHSSDVVFSSDRDCLSLMWRTARDLQISCEGEPITREQINRQLGAREDVTFTYVNIANGR